MKLTVIAGCALLTTGFGTAPQPMLPVASESSSSPSALPGVGERTVQSGPAANANWRDVLYPQDQDAIGSIDQVWRAVLRQAREHGHSAQLQALGAVVRPENDRSNGSMPQTGSYRCRSIQLGSTTGGLTFVSYPWFTCRIGSARGRPTLTKTTGSQRTQGTIFPNGSSGIYAGAQAWGDDETTFGLYGDEDRRDDFGVVQRLGNGHWRVVSPRPRQGGLLNILELRRN